MIFDTIKNQLKDYFRLTPYLEDENQAKQSIIEGVSFRGPNIIILILAIIVASLGLNINSAPVVIGAMLISPLMGPIIGLGLGVGIYDFNLIKRAVRNLAAAAVFSVIASTLYFLISPVSEGHSELLARTSPSIYDVLIGFFAGGAGIVAVACKQKGNVIPGAAIATALLPPLCTVGYGIATLQPHYIIGALYLFLINSIFIGLSSLIGVKLFHFHEVTFVDPNRRKRIKRVVTTVAIITMLPAIYLTFQMLRENFFINNATEFVDNEFNFPNTQVFSKKIYTNHSKKYIDVTLIGQLVNTDSLSLALTAKMDKNRFLRGSILNIKQGFSLGSVEQSSPKQELGNAFISVVNQIESQKTTIDSLNNILAQRNATDSLSYAIAPEIKVLYPNIDYISIQRSYVCNVDTRKIDTVNIALIDYTGTLNDKATIQKYLETRTGLTNVHIITQRARE